ncbi:hypothetical protein Stsp02_44890 [Streptomyces sp. NBRC 14336]|uniref:hypothetical protein n=1 Tax=Streptomyces sp. NBRC 14336 TaxID=3030992 RepID=UPI0024A02004|nr:hypothetical protein [Streptomyces sp. NBRC 14336]WBO75854.1 hypothetical protein SBE_006591 [Streptomyces sp. SBE_14.2]GLW48827.1 hypothetical protein Stsp02_44890 [Streptomyces sp. NBRC 14336]
MALAQWTNAMEWLAAAATDPRSCKNDWQRGTTGVHLLAAGRFWDVLIVPACLGLHAADILADLPRLEPGPALLDSRRQHIGFFLPPAPSSVWAGHDIRYLTRGGWIATPAPHCRWGDLRWICPPDGSGTLNTPEALELALHQAMHELARTHGIPHQHHAPHHGTAHGTQAPPPTAAPYA